MAELDDMIATVKALGGSLPEMARAAGARVVEVVRTSAAAGEAPEGGGAWAPKKDGGGRAMTNAASHITDATVGTFVRVQLTGPDVFHNYSKKKSEPARKVIPDGGAGVPDDIADAIVAGCTDVFERVTGAR